MMKPGWIRQRFGRDANAHRGRASEAPPGQDTDVLKCLPAPSHRPDQVDPPRELANRPVLLAAARRLRETRVRPRRAQSRRVRIDAPLAHAALRYIEADRCYRAEPDRPAVSVLL
jgi:hypothetical protein